MGKFIDLTNQIFNEWEVLEYTGGGMWKCRCSCGVIRNVNSKSLRHGTSTSCGHLRKVNIENEQFGNWLVLQQLDSYDCLAKCLLCGNIKKVKISNLKSGSSTSCGCQKPSMRKPRLEITGTHIGEWEVGEYVGDGYWKCTCSCGTVRNIKGAELVRGRTKSCGCVNFTDLTGKFFGGLEVLQYLGHGEYLCKCHYCGNVVSIDVHRLKYDNRDNCGCQKSVRTKQTMMIRYGDPSTNHVHNPRTQEQIEAVSSREKFIDFINKLDKKPTTYELSKLLGLTADRVLKLSHDFDCDDMISIGTGSSIENDMCELLLKEFHLNIKQHDRSTIYPKEIDFLIKDRHIGIEMNGDYWHSEGFKSSDDNQIKTMEALKKNIRLIHIFEYEWKDPIKQDRIRMYLGNIFNTEYKSIGARETEVKEINGDEAFDFCNKYHLQGGLHSKINIGCYHNSELIGVLSISKPRFDKSFEYEITRMCWKYGIKVSGGSERLFSYFINKYNPDNIITYVDIAKFTGNIYTRLGFKANIDSLTKPNYVWVRHSKLIPEVLTRYQTQKHLLIEKGLGDDSQTEREIMENNGYIRVYDCGNLKLVWSKNNL